MPPGGLQFSATILNKIRANAASGDPGQSTYEPVGKWWVNLVPQIGSQTDSADQTVYATTFKLYGGYNSAVKGNSRFSIRSKEYQAIESPIHSGKGLREKTEVTVQLRN